MFYFIYAFGINIALSLYINLLQEFDTSEFIMDIKGNSLFAQMQEMQGAALNPNQATSTINGDMPMVKGVNSSQSDFGELLQDAIGKVNELQMDSGAKRKAFQMGDEGVTLAETMIASSKAGLAFDATLQVRNKFVEAYKEIMSMPV